jgi:lipid A 3-O-deacylase
MKNTWNCLACVCLVSASACAEDGFGKEEPVKAETGTGAPFISALSLGYGWAHNDTDIYRAAVRHDPGYSWLSNPTGWMSLYYEASMNLWKSGGDEIYAAAFSPVFIYYFGKPENKVRPYVEAGIGAAGISKTEMGNRQFSTGYQFEDRVGAGVQIKNLDLCCRYMHYSNASIKEPNDGIDIVMVALGYRL